MQVFPLLIPILLFAIDNNAGQTLKSSEDFSSNYSKLPPKSVRCKLRDELSDDFYQSEQTGETYLFKNLPDEETAADLRSSKKVTNITENMNIPNSRMNIPDLLNSTDMLAELNQVNVSIDVLKALLNEYSSAMEVDGSRTESSDTDELVRDYESVSNTLMEQNTTEPSSWWELFSTKFNKTRVNSDQTLDEGISSIMKHLALNSSMRNQLKLKEIDVPTIPLAPSDHDKVARKQPSALHSSNKNKTLTDEKSVPTIRKESLQLNSSNENQTLSEEKTVPTIRKESLQQNSLDENQTLSEKRVISSTTKSPIFRNQLVVDEQDFKRLTQHIIASLENIEDGITVLAKENAIISEEIRSMENLQENNVKYHAKERNNFMDLLKVLYNVYQDTSNNLISIQDKKKTVNNGLLNKNVHYTSSNNMGTKRSVIDDSRRGYGTKFDDLNSLVSTTKRYEDGVTSAMKYTIFIVGNNENKTIKFFKNDSVGDSRTINITSRYTFDKGLGNVIDVIKKSLPEYHPVVVEYEMKNDGRNDS